MADREPNILEPKKPRSKFVPGAQLRKDLEILTKSKDIPEDINPFSNQVENFIQQAILAVAPKLSGNKLRTQIANMQQGMARAILSGMTPNVDPSAHFAECRKFINVIATAPGGAEAAEIVGYSFEATGENPRLIEAQAVADKKRQEADRKQQEQAREVAAAAAAKTKAPRNFHGSDRFDISTLDNADYLKVRAFLLKKLARETRSLAAMMAAGMIYSAAYEGDYSASASSRSSDYVMASTRTSPTQYMSFSTPWQSTIEREIQRQEWRTNPPPPYVPEWDKPIEAPPKTPEQRAITAFLDENPGSVRGSGNIVYKPGEGAVTVDKHGNVTPHKTKDEVAAQLEETRAAEAKAAAQGWRLLPNGNTMLPDGRVIASNGDELVDRDTARKLEEQALEIARARVISDEIGRRALREGKTREEIANIPGSVKAHSKGTELTDDQAAAHRRETERTLGVVSDMAVKKAEEDKKKVGAGVALKQPSVYDRWTKPIEWLAWMAKGTKSEKEIEILRQLDPTNPVEKAEYDRRVNAMITRALSKGLRDTGTKLETALDGQQAGETIEQLKARLARQQHERSVSSAGLASSLNPFDSRTPQQRAIEEAANQAAYRNSQQPVYDQFGTMTGFVTELPKPEQAVEPDNTAVVKPRSTWDWMLGRDETPQQKQAREDLAVKAAQDKALADAKAASEPTLYGRTFGESEATIKAREAAKIKYESMLAEAEIKRQLAANPALEVPKGPPAGLVAAQVVVTPAAVVVGGEGTVVAPVDKGKGVVVEGAPGEERTEAYIKSSRRFAGLDTPKSTLGAIRRYGQPIAQTVGRVGSANDPVPEAVTAPKGIAGEPVAAKVETPKGSGEAVAVDTPKSGTEAPPAAKAEAVQVAKVEPKRAGMGPQ